MTIPVLQAGEQRATYSSTTTVTVNKPASVAAGDLLIVEISADSTNASWSSSGWTAGPTQVAGTPGIFSFWRIADGSEGASFTFTFGGTNRTGAAICHRITGAHQTSPIDVSGSAFVAAGGANPISLPSVTTTGPDRLLMGVFDSKSASSATFTTPTGMTAAYAYTAGSSGAGQQAMFTESFPTAGATGTRSSNSSQTTLARSGLLLAIAPPSVSKSLPSQGNRSSRQHLIRR